MAITDQTIGGKLSRAQGRPRGIETSEHTGWTTTWSAAYGWISQTASAGLFRFMEEVIETLNTNGRMRTAETYACALRSFRRFRGGADIALAEFTATIAEAYEAWLRAKGLTANTSSFYLRILRAVYNRAVDTGLTPDRAPFRRAYTGVDRTAKRALDLATLRAVNRLDLAARPALGFARDMFVLSFYLRGMSFVDMAFLRKADLEGATLTYRRRKTGQVLSIAWTAEMQAIVDRHPAGADGYLLPILPEGAQNPRRAYLNRSYSINRALRIIGRTLGLTAPLTMYVARHSWASVARAKGVPLSVISEGLGHDSEATTQIYLASLEASVVDRANSMIIESLG